MPRPLLPIAALAVALLAACGSSSASSTAGSPAASSAGSSAAPATSAASSSAPATSSGAAVDAAALCEFLKTELPKIKAVGSKVGAQAQFVIAFFEWGEPKGLSGATQQQFDDAAKSSCPDLRDQIAAATGQTGLLS